MNTMIIAMWSMVLFTMGLLVGEQLIEGGVCNPKWLLNLMSLIKVTFTSKVMPILHEYRVELGVYFASMSILLLLTMAVPYLV